jgi:putative FmdB family regulatory protein
LTGLPTYEYKCGECGHRFEVFQRMTDDPVSECEDCGGGVQRVLFPVAVHFKGSGFYTTDYARKKTLCAKTTGGGSSDGGDCASCEKATSTAPAVEKAAATGDD